MTRFILFFSIITLAAVANATDLSDYVKFRTSPKSPVIINSDNKYFDPNDGELVVISAPWFGMGYYFKNSHPTHTLMIPSLKLVITGRNQGVVTEKEIYLDASDICGAEMERKFLAQVAPGTEWREDGGCDNIYDGTSDLRLYVHGLLPNNDYVYEVKVIADGYFSSPDGDSDHRVSKVTKFKTQ